MDFVSIALGVAGVYLAAGTLFAIPFVLKVVTRIDPHAVGGTWGFRLLILPGTMVLWPLLLWRWMSGEAQPPAEHNAHRRAVRRPDF